MTQTKIQTAKEVLFAAKEGTFGALPGTMKPLIIEADSYEGDQSKDALEDLDSSARLMDEQVRVDGFFNGSAKFKAKLKPFATQIISSVPTDQPALMDILECSLGGMHCGVGGTISAGTASQVTLSSVTGMRVGEVFGISGGGDNQLAVVETLPGSGVVTFWPSVGTAVTTGNAVKGYNAFSSETATSTFSLQHAYPDSADEQEEFRGCYAKVKLNSAPNSIVTLDIDVMPATGQRGALGLSTSVQTNPLVSGGVVFNNAVLYVQTAATTTRTNYCVEEFGFEFDPQIEFTPCGSAVDGKDGVMRVKGRGLAKLMLKIRADSDEFTAWTARTVRRVLLGLPRGSGTTKRWVYVYMPRAVLARAPKPTKSGGRLLYELEFHSQINNAAAADSIGGASVVLGAL